MATRPLPKLNDDQVDSILIESLNRGLLEADVEGNLPSDPVVRLEMAQTMVVMADQAFQAGSRDADVAAVLFLAEVEMVPRATTTTEGESAVGDMTTLDDALLVKIERSLATGDSDTNADDLAQARDEIERRGLATPWKTAETNGGPPVAATPVEDPEPTEEPAAAPIEVDGAVRKALEDRLTFGIMRVHGIDPSEISGLSMETLQWVVEHPDPGPAVESAPEIIPVAAAEPQQPNPGETIETTHMVVPQRQTSAPEPDAEWKAAVAEATAPTDAREELEGQVTGPMLKAYGRGRVDVPGIGDNELAFMIEHPDGRVLPADLVAARAQDQGTAPAEVPETAEEEESQTAEDAFAPPTEAAPIAEPDPAVVLPDNVRDVFEQAKSPVPENTFEYPLDNMTTTLVPETFAKVAPPAPLAVHVPQEANRDAKAHFDAIVEKERLPLPAEIDDPPRMPNDMSKSSRDEIYSFHARFHACEARVSFLITNEEDSLGDLEKLRAVREIQVAAELPATVDGKRVTDAYRNAKIAGDAQVQAYALAEHNIQKTLRKLKVLRDGYHRDCERCSRQLTKWAREYEGATA